MSNQARSGQTDGQAVVLAGKGALITGASSGIGFAVAQRLAGLGMNLHLLARDESRLEAARTRLLEQNPDIAVDNYPIDLSSSPAALRASLPDLPLAVLVHSAGHFSATSVLAIDPAEMESMFRTNTSSALTIAQHYAQSLEDNAGQIVLVNSSVAQQQAKAVPGAYAATKHALLALGDSLRDAFNARGVRVLSVFPGRTATPMQEAIFAGEGRDYPQERLLQAEDIADVIATSLALPRTAEVTDISIRPFLKG